MERWSITSIRRGNETIHLNFIEGAHTMELAQLLISPGMLLAAFIFFWKQNRIIIDELKREIVPLHEEITSIREEMHDMNGRLGRVEGLLMILDFEKLRKK